METVKSLLSEDPAMLLRESMGLASDGAHKAFPSKDVDAFLDGPRATIHVDIMGRNSRDNTNHFVLAGDPSGGGASQFSICTMAQMPTGRVVVRRRPGPSPPTPRAASCPRAPRARARP